MLTVPSLAPTLSFPVAMYSSVGYLLIVLRNVLALIALPVPMLSSGKPRACEGAGGSNDDRRRTHMWGFPVFANTGSGKPRACEGAGGSNELLRVSDRSKGGGVRGGGGVPT